jgi:hypothetical protein
MDDEDTKPPKPPVPQGVDNPWRLQDFAIFIPVLTTGLAVSYEAGRIAPTGGFYYFTLTDHLVAAAPAFPLAMLSSFGVAITSLAFRMFGRLKWVANRRIILLAFGAVDVFSVVAFSFCLYRYGEDMPFVPLVATVLLIITSIPFMVIRPPARADVNLILVSVFAVLFSAAFGEFLGRSKLEQAQTDERRLSMITTKSGVFRGYVVMVGERGLLSYAPQTNGFAFIRTDEILKIDWPRL